MSDLVARVIVSTSGAQPRFRVNGFTQPRRWARAAAVTAVTARVRACVLIGPVLDKVTLD